ncbi:MAG: hypothetical protein EON58_00460 [Alphaproteobacteria bacterium]|nr:MAG: hypothetical protein EON58_00460 [Alphaproteobacteria bacterium]
MAMKRLNRDSIRPGDILFSARPGAVGKTIRGLTRGEVSHAMICVQHSSFIDSTMEGVHARNVQRLFFEDDEIVFHFRLSEDVAPERLAAIIEYARSQIGARYSLPEAARSVMAVRKPRTRKQFCSRLVAQAYKSAGFELVPDADYCSPEMLRRSPLLLELPVQTEAVTAKELDWWNNNPDAVERTLGGYSRFFSLVRKFAPNVETQDDLLRLRIHNVEADPHVVEAFHQSGFLDLWRIDIHLHPWRYDLALMAQQRGNHLRPYCVSTIQEAYTGGLRFAQNLATLRRFHKDFPRPSLELEIKLYKTLAQNHQSRREVAYSWLLAHHPDDLARHMEQIAPHSSEWFRIVQVVDEDLANLSGYAIQQEGSSFVCSSCGELPARAYRIVNEADVNPGVPSLSLCEDCLEIRRGLGYVLQPFLEQ